MAAVTQTIDNYLGGVSNQPDDKKLPGQVREAVNAYPDPTFGLQKRPGLKFLKELTDGSSAFDNNDLDTAKWFYYNRDSDEKYIGCIVGNATPANAAIHVWNTTDLTKCTVDYDGTLFEITDDGGGNGTAATLTNLATTTSGSGSGLTVDVTIHSDGTCTNVKVNAEGNTSYNYGDTITISKSLIPGSGAGSKIDEDVICKITAREVVGSYLSSVTSNDYDVLTVRDTTHITNKKTPITVIAGDAHTDNQVGTVRIHLVEYSAGYSVTIHPSGAGAATYTVNTRSGDTASSDADTTGKLDAEEILTAMKGLIDAASISNLTVTVIGSTLELKRTSGTFTLTAKGGVGGENLTAYQNEVNNSQELSGVTVHGRVVTVKNTNSTIDTYHTKFKANDGISGSGTWEECLKPGAEKGLVSSTMPHKLYNNAKNAFIFSPIPWVERTVGDDLTNEHPSFVEKDPFGVYIGTIQQSFFYNNRLGFLTSDNVSMSKAAAFYDFYMTTAQTSTDADPIDINASSTKHGDLLSIVPSAGGLLLYSAEQQFIMYSADGNLKPTTALIRTLSNYKMDKEIDPVDVGTQINFVSKTHDSAGFVRVFAMIPQGGGSSPVVVDIGRVVAEYIPVGIDSLTASAQNSFIAMYGKTLDKIWFYRTYNDGQKDLMQTWFNWQLPGNVHYMNTDSDTMYTIVKTGTGGSARYNLCSATMTQTPEETIITTAEGQQVNPHMDFYTAATNGLTGGSEKKVVYDSTNDFSKCYIPFEDVTTLTPVIVISGNATSNFSGTTESGFTITPTRTSVGSDTYFKVPNKDLSAQAANVYVGYKYNYDITLPKVYFQGQQGADFTANLTISRCKFSIGQSSVVGFKLQRKGVQAATQTFTGDGSTTAFSPDFTVKDKADVIVKKNGAKQILTTDYTIADHATNPDQITVTFGAAPAAASTAANVTTAADTVEIYVDNWYTLQPTQEANYYLGDDVPIETQNTFVVPIHQRTDNYTLRVFSDSPFPVALTAMAWEGNYSPRYYRRT